MSKNKYCSCCGSPTETLLSADTVAAMLDCSVETIRDWIQKRKVGSKKIMGLRRIHWSEIERYLEDSPSIDEFAHEALV